MSHHRESVTAPGAPAAVGPYVHAVRAGGLLFCSGQIPLHPETGEIVGATAAEQAGRCLENLQAVCAAAGASLADAMAALGLASGGTLHVVPPLGYFEMIGAIRDASIVVTDSGGVQREAYWLGIPCVTMRTETEWRETVALGANVLVAPSRAEAELASVVAARLGTGGTWDRTAYGDGKAAAVIVDAIGVLERAAA